MIWPGAAAEQPDPLEALRGQLQHHFALLDEIAKADPKAVRDSALRDVLGRFQEAKSQVEEKAGQEEAKALEALRTAGNGMTPNAQAALKKDVERLGRLLNKKNELEAKKETLTQRLDCRNALLAELESKLDLCKSRVDQVSALEQSFDPVYHSLAQVKKSAQAAERAKDRFENAFREALISTLGEDCARLLQDALGESGVQHLQNLLFEAQSNPQQLEAASSLLAQKLREVMPQEKRKWRLPPNAFLAGAGLCLVATIILAVRMAIRVTLRETFSLLESGVPLGSQEDALRLQMTTDRVDKFLSLLGKSQGDFSFRAQCYSRDGQGNFLWRNDAQIALINFLASQADWPEHINDVNCILKPDAQATDSQVRWQRFSQQAETDFLCALASIALMPVLMVAYFVQLRLQKEETPEPRIAPDAHRQVMAHKSLQKAAEHYANMTPRVGELKAHFQQNVLALYADTQSGAGQDKLVSQPIDSWRSLIDDLTHVQSVLDKAKTWRIDRFLEREGLAPSLDLQAEWKDLRERLNGALASQQKERDEAEKIEERLRKIDPEIQGQDKRREANEEKVKQNDEALSTAKVRIAEIGRQKKNDISVLQKRYHEDKAAIDQQYGQAVTQLDAKRNELNSHISEGEIASALEQLMTQRAFELVQQRHLGVAPDNLLQRIGEGRFTNWAGEEVSAPAPRASSYFSSVHLLQAVVDAHDHFKKTGAKQSAELVVAHQHKLGIAVSQTPSGEAREHPARASQVSFVLDRNGEPRISHIFPLAG